MYLLRIAIIVTSVPHPSLEYTTCQNVSSLPAACGLWRTDSPEVLDNFIGLRVASVIGMLLPVFHINIRNTANEQLELACVEDIDKIRRDQFVEACYKGRELLLDPLLDPPFSDQTAHWLA